MKPFLAELAKNIYEKHRSFEELTIVFPNRRAILYFRKHLSALLNKPAFAPRLVTIEDYFLSLSNLKVPDKLELIHMLYNVYYDIVSVASPSKTIDREPFHQFYFWGEMLLRDFDEADKYLVGASQLFKDLSHQKELDSSFDYLTEEQREFLRNFWSSFDDNITENKKKFLNVWNKLYLLYVTFKEKLLEEGLAFEGMLQRLVADKMVDGLKHAVATKHVVFAGFNALTKAEEKVISYHVQQGLGEVYWDIDEYYVNNNTQEAGKFFREYQNHPILGKTFPKDLPSNLLSGFRKSLPGDSSEGSVPSTTKSVRLFGASQPLSQAKLMAQVLKEQMAKGINPEDTLIVLPDENLLLPVLHSVSGDVEKLNVTMGFPIGATPVFNLVEVLVEMQINSKGDEFNHREVLALLGHPYLIAEDAGVANEKRKEILSRNWVHIPMGYLASKTHLHRLIFKHVEDSILTYLRTIITAIGNLESITDFDREYILHFIKLLNRVQEIAGGTYEVNRGVTDSTQSKQSVKFFQTSLKAFLRLFRQLVQMQKIPFSGEPLKGLQIMGVLETRNLDFKNVFILSLNEGSFPSFGSKNSYIPFSIRKAYGLPTVEYQDAMYAYLFYRVIQRAENVFLFYNTETDVLGQGESSRYLKQLIYESGLTMERKVLHDPIQPNVLNPIIIQKDNKVIDALVKLNEGNMMFKGISPSALNTYIECRLRFYLRHVAKIKEPNEVEEDLDARVLGNFLHAVMELFYRRIQEAKKTTQIAPEDFDHAEAKIDRLIDEVFINAYQLDPGKPVVYEGQRLVVREVVKRFAHRIIEMDKVYSPFVIEVLEQGGLAYTVPINQFPGETIISGKIDRVDRKGNLIRVIDYKTGKDRLDFESVASLFSRDGKRNKAVFQTMLYALLYKVNAPRSDDKIVPGLINRMNLFDKDFKFGLKVGKTFVEDVEPLLPEFESQLKLLLEELYNPNVPFDQTTDTEMCKFCPYQRICYR
jgi:CRISPR/Cas system-associated exonuclease Cas4 (RecB family)